MKHPSITAIETVSGRFVDLVDPDPSTIDIHDIAWALSRMPRYVGHTVSTLPYSIAQHSVAVLDLVTRLRHGVSAMELQTSFIEFADEFISRSADQAAASEIALDARGMLEAPSLDRKLLLELLLHDASEAYIVDVPTPLKQAPGFKEVYMAHEERMMRCIRHAFGMEPIIDPRHDLIVKWADLAALTIEAYHLIYSRGANWHRLLRFDIQIMGEFEKPKTSMEAYQDFRQWFSALSS